MFNQRKSFLKGKLFYIVLLALFALGLWLNQAPVTDGYPDDVNAGTDYSSAAEKDARQGNGDDDIMENIIGRNRTVTSGGVVNADTETSPTDSEQTGYYLVKEVNGIIKIFYYNNEGKESLIRDTDIAFSLLSVADQALFRRGVIKHTPEELNELLQDFES